MNITVYNDGEKVFEGTLENFLTTNENDVFLVELTRNKQSGDVLEFAEQSGSWLIEFK